MFEVLEERRVLASFPAPIEAWEQAEFIDNQAMVRFLPTVPPAYIQSFLGSFGATVESQWDEINLFHIRLNTSHSRVTTLSQVKTLHDMPFVEYAEPNLIRHSDQVPNDPLFLDQWGLHNTGQLSPYPPFFPGIFDADIDAPEAWDVEIGDPRTILAIIDTGTDYTHPDLAANIWTNPGERPDGLDNDANGFIDDVIGWDTFDNDNDPQDEDGHGTHVAGIAGAIGDNGTGVSGVAWNSQLLIIKASDDSGAFSIASIVGAQFYLLRLKEQFGHNIVASNNSYGALGQGAFSFAEFDAIRLATQGGIAFITSAGNDGLSTDAPTTPHFPSGYTLPGIISVAATNRSDQLAAFSNRGFFSVDLGAPGVEILSTASTLPPPLGPDPLPGQPPAPNVPPPGYGWLDGTSMASPMVAGAYAVIKSFDPQLTVAQVKNLMLQTVDVLPSLRNVTQSGGRLNLARALDEIPRNEFIGTVFLDRDGDAVFDAAEVGQSGWTVYVDLNNNSQLDPGEPNTVSQADGTYNLGARLLPGTYLIREIVQAGWRQTLPGPLNDFAHRVTVSTSLDVFRNLNFGNRPVPGSASGIKYNDLDGDGQRDPGEPGIQGIVIYADVNNDGRIGIGEPGSITDSQGRFQINNIDPGIVIIREVPQPGFVQTQPDPAGPNGGGISVFIVGGSVTQGLLFGNRVARDFGDAPASYGTLQADNGPSHGGLTGFFLGDASDTSVSHADFESDGQPSVDADGDDVDQSDDDEDGVLFLTDVIPGENATLQVSVSNGPFGAGLLQGWIDFNNDGDFLDPDEQIIRNRSLATGTHQITFAVPATASVADTFARFRWGFERDLGPSGPSTAGEVEDYSTSARATAPTANDDFETAFRDSNFIDNEFDVLANDFPGVAGDPFELFQFDSTTSAGGNVILEDQGNLDPSDDTLRYKPKPGFIGLDTFQYQIWDGTNTSNFATVTIDVQPLDPVAIDDTFDISTGLVFRSLDVLANDIEGPAGALTVVSVSGTAAGGIATVDFVNNEIDYRPPSASFVGSDSFTYVVQDSSGKSSQARVLVQVGGVSPGHIAQIEYRIFNDAGIELAANAPVQLGATLELRAFTRDLRGSVPDPQNTLPDISGVISAYADVLYNSSLVTPVTASNIFGIEIVFGPAYTEGRSATASVPGIVDEAGAFTSQGVLGPSDIFLFSIKFTAENEGALKFSPNPEDHPIFEVAVNDATTGNPTALANNQVFYRSSPTIQIVGAGEGEGTNEINPLDVNQDMIVSPTDALLVISHLNRNGAGAFTPARAASSGFGLPQYFLDVNVDGNVSAMDAKLVIDYLNLKAMASLTSTAAAEGEGDASLSLAIGSSSGSSSKSSTSTSKSSSDLIDPVSADQVFAEGAFPTAAQSSSGTVEDDGSDDKEEAEDEEDIFASL